MSSSPQTVVDISMCEAGATPKVGYMNGSDGTTPMCHMGTLSRAYSVCPRSLLISLRTRRCMPLTKRMEQCGGLFVDSASTLFFGGERSVTGSYQRTTHHPVLHHYCLA